jgi:hypothetical protein
MKTHSTVAASVYTYFNNAIGFRRDWTSTCNPRCKAICCASRNDGLQHRGEVSRKVDMRRIVVSLILLVGV